MSHLLALIEQYGLVAVFINVFVEQLGAPVPAYPALVITGALLERGHYTVSSLLLTAVVAALIADYFWYVAGKRYGRKVIAGLCRISLSPDSCTQKTESTYTRWGPASLLVAKFIPGFASIVSALAGTLGTRSLTFITFDAIGATIWAGSAIFLGSLFKTTIDDLLDVLTGLGKWGLLLIGMALVAFIAKKWWQRDRFLKSLRMARVSVDELYSLWQTDVPPIIVDVRPTYAQREGRIPGALMVTLEDFPGTLPDVGTDQEVVVYCACPNEASAARVAKLLLQHGFTKVRPLHGGIDAWVAAGYVLESGKTM
jgi:membrane protein DedA with SNARE-associated domain/rhodanese-related sulfurtransferase